MNGARVPPMMSLASSFSIITTTTRELVTRFTAPARGNRTGGAPAWPHAAIPSATSTETSAARLTTTFRMSGVRGGFGHIAAGERQVEHEHEDAAQEDVARPGRAEAEPAVLVAVLGHEGADRRAQRPGEDVGQPERQPRVELERIVGDRDQRDDAAEDGDRRAVADRELLGDQVAGGGAEGEREQDGQPVEPFAAAGEDRLDRERALEAPPDGE